MSPRAIYSTLFAAVLVILMVILGRSPNRPPAPVEDSAATAAPAEVPAPTAAAPEMTKSGPRVPLAQDPTLGVLIGRVIDPLGNALQRCEVTAQLAPATITVRRDPRGEPVLALTDENGRFRLEHRAGEPLIVTLSHKDFPPTVVRTETALVVNRPTDLGDLTLRSQPGLVVTVTDAATGQPTEQARIELRPQIEDPTLPGHALELARRWAVTDRQGSGILFGVEPGNYVLRVEAASYATMERPYVRASDAAPEQQSVALAPGQVLRGRVLTPGGAVDAGAQIISSPLRGGPAFAAVTGKDGSFRLEGLAAGAYRVTVDSPRFGSLTLSHVDVGTNAPPLEIQLAAGAELFGTVREARSGLPVAEAKVSITLADGRPLFRAGRIVRPATVTDEQGRFRLGGLPDEPLRVAVEALRLAPASVGPVQPGQACNVQLDPECSIDGRVLDANGLPVADATVRAVPAAHDGSAFADLLAEVVPAGKRVDRTNAEGSFRIGGLRPGDIKLMVRHPQHAPHLQPVSGLQPGTPAVVDVRLQRSRSVAGIVRDAGGEPLAQALVYLDPLPGSDGIAARTIANDRGEFQLSPVAVGLYSLYSSRPDQPAAPGPVVKVMVPLDKDPERQTVYAAAR